MERAQVAVWLVLGSACTLIRRTSLRIVKMLMDVFACLTFSCQACHLNRKSFKETGANLRRIMRLRLKTIIFFTCLSLTSVTILLSALGTPSSFVRTVPSIDVLRLFSYDSESGDIFGDLHPFHNSSEYLRCVDPEGLGKVQDTLCMQRPNFLSTYKNPCWFDYNEEKLRCLPYFHILGVDKSGTTDLHSRIAQHPHVLNNSGGIGKETYYWCWLKYGQFMKRVTTPRPFSYYLHLFDEPASTMAKNPDLIGYHPVITGDATPMDFWDFRAWPLIPQNKGLKEPAVLTPHLMRHLYPDPKFIIIMRDPVDRLYSDYIFLGYGRSPEQFRKDVPTAVALMTDCMKVFTIRQCVYSNDTYTHLPMRIHVGMYSVFMKEWLAVFPKSNFYILRTEDYHSNMTYHLRNIYEFLGLKPLPDKMFQDILDANRKHETAIKTTLPDMFPDTRQILQDFYAPFNRELALLLDDDAYLWEPDSKTHAGGTTDIINVT